MIFAQGCYTDPPDLSALERRLLVSVAMAALDDLISRVGDDSLRRRLRDEVGRLRAGRKFGLVFENHLPEVVAVPTRPLTAGCVAVRDDADPARRVVIVRHINGDEATVAPVGSVAASRTGTATSTAGGGVGEFCVPVAELVAADDLDHCGLVPLLEPVGECVGPDADPSVLSHVLVEAENYHALRLLSFTHAGKVDCVYIDPPYNTGATDWAYNNRFVGDSDSYRHSMWLSMMQRRLRLARGLLKPDGVLIVTIDECEVHRLALLLEQMFPDATHQMVTVMILPQGNSRSTFTRVDEYVLFCFFGDAKADGFGVCEWGDDHLTGKSSDGNEPPQQKPVRWTALLRSGNNSRPQDSPGSCYPVFINEGLEVVGVGRTLKQRSDAGEIDATAVAYDGYVPSVEGLVDDVTSLGVADGVALWTTPVTDETVKGAVRVLWPRDRRKRLACWRQGPSTLLERVRQRRVKVNETSDGKLTVWSLTNAQMDAIEAGELAVAADDPGYGPLQLDPVLKMKKPMTMWTRTRHKAGGPHGTTLLENLLGEKRFNFPKSLYSTLDAVGAVVADRPDAMVVDFFAGSGTTLHAVALLNLADGGRRRCIAVTNNEVSSKTVKELRKSGLRPGDREWEAVGVCRNVTWPRIQAAFTGHTAAGNPVSGKYLPVPFGPQLDPDYQPKVHERAIAEGLPQTVTYTRLNLTEPQQIRWKPNSDWPQGLTAMWLASGCWGPAPAIPHKSAAEAAERDPGYLLPSPHGPIGEGCRFGVLLRPAFVAGFAQALREPAAKAVTNVWVVVGDERDIESARTVIGAARPDVHIQDWRSDVLAHFAAVGWRRDFPEGTS